VLPSPCAPEPRTQSERAEADLAWRVLKGGDKAPLTFGDAAPTPREVHARLPANMRINATYAASGVGAALGSSELGGGSGALAGSPSGRRKMPPEVRAREMRATPCAPTRACPRCAAAPGPRTHTRLERPSRPRACAVSPTPLCRPVLPLRAVCAIVDVVVALVLASSPARASRQAAGSATRVARRHGGRRSTVLTVTQDSTASRAAVRAARRS
jgi:hypothetical protein